MYACGGLSLLFANRDTGLAWGRSLFEKSLDFWRDLPLGLFGRDNDFEDSFAQGGKFELFGPRVMSARHRWILPKLAHFDSRTSKSYRF